ncbi:Tn3 family transposase [Streptomyces sp. NPDC001393]
MINCATAIRIRTASTEAILRRFTRSAAHPTYAAMLEVGRALKTVFVARHLRLRDLQLGDRGGPERHGVLQRSQLRDRPAGPLVCSTVRRDAYVIGVSP